MQAKMVKHAKMVKSMLKKGNASKIVKSKIQAEMLKCKPKCQSESLSVKAQVDK